MRSLLNTPLGAFCAPFVVFMLFLGLRDVVTDKTSAHWLIARPEYWIYPLQTVVCGFLIAIGWRHYRLKWSESAKNWALSLGVAILVLIIWISPQLFFGFEPRLEGFDPTLLRAGSPEYWATLLFRFLRLVVVVPILEEVFWRGFLMRYLIREDFEAVPVGAYAPLAFWATVGAFGLAHYGPDLPAALVTGVLYNLVAIRTRSIALCIAAHALTNLLLGLYIMQTGQWGFW